MEIKTLAQELIHRRRARESLSYFATYIKHDYVLAGHHKKIIDLLERVERGEINRVCIFQPPRSGKSELVSRLFPAWYIGRNPSKQIITASYGGDLARTFGRSVRNAIDSEDYRNIFPNVRLAEDSRSANMWNTSEGGAYIAVGVGSGTSGFGSHISLIDDPFRDRQDADSKMVRDRVWDWYSSVLYTRRMPGAAIILCCTRWHEDDLAGRLLANQEKGDKWEVLSLPAIANEHTDHEEALWPEWFPLEELRKTRAVMIPRDWRALYQQQPTAEEGDYFKKDWFKKFKFSDMPPMHYYIGSDFAVTDKGGDFTWHIVFGVAHTEDIYIIDAWCGQTTPDIWIDELLLLMQKYRPMAVFCESGVIRRSVEPFLVKRMRERAIYARIVWLASVSDKATRARAFQARCAMGTVRVPETDIAERIIGELTAFPTGKYDDAVDACSIFARGLEDVHGTHIAHGMSEITTDRWREDDAIESPSWRLL